MMLLTCATHVMSVAISKNFWKYPWLGWLRVLIVSGVYLVTGLLLSNQNALKNVPFPTNIPPANETDSPLFLPASCFQGGSLLLKNALDTSFAGKSEAKEAFLNSNLGGGHHIQGWNFYLLILLWYGLAIVVDLVRFLRRGMDKSSFRRKVARRLCGSCTGRKSPRLTVVAELSFGVYLLISVAISGLTVAISANYMMGLRAWVKRSGWLETDPGGQSAEDDATSFGQLVPIFLCLLTLFAFAQTISGRWLLRGTSSRPRGEAKANVIAEMGSRGKEKKASVAGTAGYDPENGHNDFSPDKKGPMVNVNVYSVAPTPPAVSADWAESQSNFWAIQPHHGPQQQYGPQQYHRTPQHHSPPQQHPQPGHATYAQHGSTSTLHGPPGYVSPGPSVISQPRQTGHHHAGHASSQSLSAVSSVPSHPHGHKVMRKPTPH